MNIEYPYLKLRSEFGSPCQFFNEGPNILFEFSPEKSFGDLYTLKNPVDKATQEGAILSLNEMNTERVDYIERGMKHDQGGWPKDLNISDEEAVLRFRKKLEREDNYVSSMKELSVPIEHAILQNNAINIYENYFENSEREFRLNEMSSQIRNTYRDPNSGVTPRTVSHISWSPLKMTFAASYCNFKYHKVINQENCDCYIWNVEIPSKPETIFESPVPILNLEWNQMEYNLLIGGMFNGRIALYDVRKPQNYVDITADVVSHRDPVHSVIWISSKAGVDFFSTSADGVIKWWDCRNLSQYTDSIILDLSKSQKLLNANAASCLEYDPGIPARYMVGTEKGQVICGNRKGATIAEKLPWVIKAHSGPIYSLMRNQGFSKIYLTVADWNVRIWSEECRESPIMWIKDYNVHVTCGEWSKSRYSVFCVSRSDGYLDLWDILLDQMSPSVSVKVSDSSLSTCRMEEHGKFLIAGDEDGFCKLLQFGESFTSCVKNDKNLLSAMFDKETHREKIIEGRTREIRLAMKLKAQQAEEKSAAAEETEAAANEARMQVLLKAEENYIEEINKSLTEYKCTVKKMIGKEDDNKTKNE